MEDLWRSRPAPQPLDLDSLLPQAQGQQANGGAGAGAGGSTCKALGLADAHAVWTVAQNAALFLQAVQQFLDDRPEEIGAAQVGAGPMPRPAGVGLGAFRGGFSQRFM